MSNETILVVETRSSSAWSSRTISSGWDTLSPLSWRTEKAWSKPWRASARPHAHGRAARGSVDGIEAAYQAKAEFDVPIIYLSATPIPIR